jgi:tetratricopeptide (TPR) repeat protein
LGTLLFFLFFRPSSKETKAINTFDFIEGKNTYLPYQFNNMTASQLNDEANYYFSEKHYNKAINKLKEAILIEPDNPKLHFNLSSCYSLTDSFHLELESLNQAIKLDSNFYGFYLFRGIAFHKHNDLSNAIKDFQKAMSINSSNWVVYTNIARAYFEKGEVDSACRNMKIAKTLGFSLPESDMPNVFLQIEQRCSSNVPNKGF